MAGRPVEIIDLTVSSSPAILEPTVISDGEVIPTIVEPTTKTARKRKQKIRLETSESVTEDLVISAVHPDEIVVISDSENTPSNGATGIRSSAKKRFTVHSKESGRDSTPKVPELRVVRNGAREDGSFNQRRSRVGSNERTGEVHPRDQRHDSQRDEDGHAGPSRNRAERRREARSIHQDRNNDLDHGESLGPMFFIDVEPADTADKPSPPLGHELAPGPVGVGSNSSDVGLTLPPHVTIATESDEPLLLGSKSLSPPPSDDGEYIQYLDYDDTQKGITRYFEQSSEDVKNKTFVCKKCGAEGEHKTFECPVMICLTCGARDDHSTRGCPISKTCFTCGMKGHINRDCPQRRAAGRPSHMAYGDCDRCGSHLHKSNECLTLWRMYEYVSDAQRGEILASRRTKKLLNLGEGGEGYIAEDEWCYHCGEEGHLGDDCDEIPFPDNFPVEPSAFSLYNTLSGPFADPNAPKPQRQRRQAREWEIGDQFDDGYGFTGPTDVGRRGKDKERVRMLKREQDVRNAEDDVGDWFSNGKQKPRLADRISDGPRRRNDKDDYRDRRRDRGSSSIQLSIKGQADRFGPQKADATVSRSFYNDRDRPSGTSYRGDDWRDDRDRDDATSGKRRYYGGYRR